MAKPGERLDSDLNETYSIFMCEHDVVGNGRAVNQFSYRNDDLFLEQDENEHGDQRNQSMGGKTRIVFVNGDYANESSEIGRLIHDFKCSKPEEMFNANLANGVRYLKEDPEGVEEMCKIMEDIRQDTEKRNSMKLTVLHVRKIMKNLGITIEKAMDTIEVPDALRTDVAQLVNSDYYR
ncbi:MAG: hypothetical protein IJ153_08650 [Clostridia bacterium]|nr:hypothetical protein [Clostridia bacterium]